MKSRAEYYTVAEFYQMFINMSTKMNQINQIKCNFDFKYGHLTRLGSFCTHKNYTSCGYSIILLDSRENLESYLF